MTHAEEAARRGAVVSHRAGDYVVRVWYTGSGYRWQADGDYGDTLVGTDTHETYDRAVRQAELAVMLAETYS